MPTLGSVHFEPCQRPRFANFAPVNRLSALLAATWWLFLMALVGAVAIGVFLAPFMGVVTFVALAGVFIYFAATRYDEEGHEHD